MMASHPAKSGVGAATTAAPTPPSGGLGRHPRGGGAGQMRLHVFDIDLVRCRMIGSELVYLGPDGRGSNMTSYVPPDVLNCSGLPHDMKVWETARAAMRDTSWVPRHGQVVCQSNMTFAMMTVKAVDGSKICIPKFHHSMAPPGYNVDTDPFSVLSVDPSLNPNLQPENGAILQHMLEIGTAQARDKGEVLTHPCSDLYKVVCLKHLTSNYSSSLMKPYLPLSIEPLPSEQWFPVVKWGRTDHPLVRNLLDASVSLSDEPFRLENVTSTMAGVVPDSRLVPEPPVTCDRSCVQQLFDAPNPAFGAMTSEEQKPGRATKAKPQSVSIMFDISPAFPEMNKTFRKYLYCSSSGPMNDDKTATQAVLGTGLPLVGRLTISHPEPVECSMEMKEDQTILVHGASVGCFNKVEVAKGFPSAKMADCVEVKPGSGFLNLKLPWSIATSGVVPGEHVHIRDPLFFAMEQEDETFVYLLYFPQMRRFADMTGDPSHGVLYAKASRFITGFYVHPDQNESLVRHMLNRSQQGLPVQVGAAKEFTPEWGVMFQADVLRHQEAAEASVAGLLKDRPLSFSIRDVSKSFYGEATPRDSAVELLKSFGIPQKALEVYSNFGYIDTLIYLHMKLSLSVGPDTRPNDVVGMLDGAAKREFDRVTRAVINVELSTMLGTWSFFSERMSASVRTYFTGHVYMADELCRRFLHDDQYTRLLAGATIFGTEGISGKRRSPEWEEAKYQIRILVNRSACYFGGAVCTTNLSSGLLEEGIWRDMLVTAPEDEENEEVSLHLYVRVKEEWPNVKSKHVITTGTKHGEKWTADSEGDIEADVYGFVITTGPIVAEGDGI